MFEYEFSGKTYRSTRSTFWRGGVSFRYRDGTRLTGLVDPARPGEAVLRPDYRPPAWVLAAAWAFVAIAAWGFGSYLAVRLNLLSLPVSRESKRKSYYREM